MKKNIDNPFYNNYLFSGHDLKKVIFNKKHWLWIWIFPTFTQISEGYAWHYKIINGAYWFIKYEKIKSIK